MEARLVLDNDGIDGNMTIFGDWSAFNPSPRTFISELFSKDIVPRPILDSIEDDSQNSFITMEVEKKIPPISFEEEEKKIGLDCTSDVQNDRTNMSQNDEKNVMLEINYTQSGTENHISSLPEHCSSGILLSPGVSPTSLLASPDYFSDFMAVSNIDQEQALPTNNASLQGNLKLLQSSETIENTLDIVADKKASQSLVVYESPPSPPSDDHQKEETGLEAEFSSFPESDPEKDGYNWRKYGQKQLKSSEFPWSYHKCTHPNCPVKKKVERSLQGHITEIIYRGAHNHPKPPNHLSGNPSSKEIHGPQTDGSDHSDPEANFKGNSSWTSTHDGSTGPERSDGLGGTSSTSSFQLEFVKPMDALCPKSNDKEENGATHSSFSVDCDIDEEMESKRRKQELGPLVKSAISRAMCEPRIVVQIPSVVDIPDDGYRWRKYGQKVVKGNPNPRSYYKCTNRGCSVRKRVERASNDLESVMSAYEGKHNHDVPSPRNMSRTRYPSSSSTATNAAHQLSSLYRRPNFAQDSFMKLEGQAPISTFGLLSRRQQLASTTSFSFGFDQPNWVSLCHLGSGLMGPFNVPFFPPIDRVMDHHQQVNCREVMPMIIPKEEPM